MPSSVESTLLRLPDGASVPKQVQRITGLHDDALVLGATPEAAWSRVLEAARSVNDTTTGRCPAVISKGGAFTSCPRARWHRSASPRASSHATTSMFGCARSLQRR